eukprot:Hpha_TRINITY_DN28196_c0_g1::TRINITY_DN28196_c0_g1_i1::g.103239::m.103239
MAGREEEEALLREAERSWDGIASDEVDALERKITANGSVPFYHRRFPMRILGGLSFVAAGATGAKAYLEKETKRMPWMVASGVCITLSAIAACRRYASDPAVMREKQVQLLARSWPSGIDSSWNQDIPDAFSRGLITGRILRYSLGRDIREGRQWVGSRLKHYGPWLIAKGLVERRTLKHVVSKCPVLAEPFASVMARGGDDLLTQDLIAGEDLRSCFERSARSERRNLQYFKNIPARFALFRGGVLRRDDVEDLFREEVQETGDIAQTIEKHWGWLEHALSMPPSALVPKEFQVALRKAYEETKQAQETLERNISLAKRAADAERKNVKEKVERAREEKTQRVEDIQTLLKELRELLKELEETKKPRQKESDASIRLRVRLSETERKLETVTAECDHNIWLAEQQAELARRRASTTVHEQEHREEKGFANRTAAIQKDWDIARQGMRKIK